MSPLELAERIEAGQPILDSTERKLIVAALRLAESCVTEGGDQAFQPKAYFAFRAARTIEDDSPRSEEVSK